MVGFPLACWVSDTDGDVGEVKEQTERQGVETGCGVHADAAIAVGGGLGRGEHGGVARSGRLHADGDRALGISGR